jgi:protein-tyrosine phosphatase
MWTVARALNVYGNDGEGMAHTLLFLCTGNYYRSRFAEILFNARASEEGLRWTAMSRGLALEKGVNNVGPMSMSAVKALDTLGIPRHGVDRYPLQVQEQDLHAAHVIIALQEAEHKPYVLERYPAWVDKVEYWHVRDVEPTPTYDPLQEIAMDMRRLISRLSPSAPGRR